MRAKKHLEPEVETQPRPQQETPVAPSPAPAPAAPAPQPEPVKKPTIGPVPDPQAQAENQPEQKPAEQKEEETESKSQAAPPGSAEALLGFKLPAKKQQNKLTAFLASLNNIGMGKEKARWVNRAVGAAYTPPRKWYRLTLLVQGVPELGEPGPRAGSGSAGSRYTGAGRSAESGPSGLSAAERDRRGRFKGNAPLSGSRPAIPPMGERSAAARAPGPAATDAAANSETEQTPLEKKKMREQVERDFAAIPRERLPDVWRLAKDAPSRILLTLERVHTPRDAADRFQWRHAAVWAWGEIQRSEENANSGSKEEMI